MTTADQQLGSSTGQKHLTPNEPPLSIAPNVSNAMKQQIAPTWAPQPPPKCSVKGLPTAPSVPSLTKNLLASVRAPNQAPVLPIAYNVPNMVGYRMAPARSTVVPPQSDASIVQPRAPVYPNPIKASPSALPKVMCTVECRACRTKTQTDAYT